MNNKEAKARIKLNKILEEEGWRFFDNEGGLANIQIELGIPKLLSQLETQREIVGRIKRKRAIVEGNHELIRLHESRVKKVIERVWEG